MNEIRVSKFLLERYHLGEVTREEKQLVEKALALDSVLVDDLARLDSSDNDFWQRYPQEKYLSAIKNNLNNNSDNIVNFSRRRVSPIIWGLCAAALIAVIAIPVLLVRDSSRIDFGERMKGVTNREPSVLDVNNLYESVDPIALNVYTIKKTSGEVIQLHDHSLIQEGKTIQLVYRLLGENDTEKYGVIFSIDGRSYVTLHYPYNVRQDTQLITGRSIPLEEAYTLDDAPNYEIFFFVTGDSPIDVGNILFTAKQLASQIANKPNYAEQFGIAAFSDYNIKVFTLIKEK